MSANKTELVIGAGNCRTPKIHPEANVSDYQNPVFLDIDPKTNPDLIWDLNNRPLPFDKARFDEIHAYEVLEHIGQQGDWRGFFEEWEEYYRILKPGGRIFASVPSLHSRWLWGDPGHTRIISVETLTFLNQKAYEDQTGQTPITDYRDWYQGDFRLLYENDDGNTFWFVMEKVDEKDEET